MATPTKKTTTTKSSEPETKGKSQPTSTVKNSPEKKEDPEIKKAPVPEAKKKDSEVIAKVALEFAKNKLGPINSESAAKKVIDDSFAYAELFVEKFNSTYSQIRSKKTPTDQKSIGEKQISFQLKSKLFNCMFSNEILQFFYI
eukprot:TRINITY_DN6347_c1_g1_i1.p3 TRINITY_DN6347_c1_g1~~TRINITY_DN6347_c1_g1_i1.p3  ORF type:complete len:143 (-),score=19.04 TRINITY_DN6347_c1_g1_i1:218-646(-)